MIDAHGVVRDFERAISEYTGASYVVTTNSCTMALLLAFKWYAKHGGRYVTLPAKTYPSVPMSAHHAGLDIQYTYYDWQMNGGYNCGSNIWDYAKRFTSGMYVEGQVQCVSFHAAKLLKIGQGGAILHDNEEADTWYRMMRFDGRTEGVLTSEDTYPEAGYHAYMSPDSAARGLWLMQSYPRHVKDQEPHDYPCMEMWSWQK